VWGVEAFVDVVSSELVGSVFVWGVEVRGNGVGGCCGCNGGLQSDSSRGSFLALAVVILVIVVIVVVSMDGRSNRR